MVDTYTFFHSGTSSAIPTQEKPYIVTQHDYDLSLPEINYSLGFPISLPTTALRILVSVSTSAIAVDTRQEAENKFRYLAETWKRQTGHLSNVNTRCTHPAYQQIIGMGKTVILFILRDLKKTQEDWFWALTAITGENPIPAQDAGHIKEMTEAWLRWGKARGYDV